MYCSKCGKSNKKGVKFCAHCGAKLTSGASVDKEAVKGAVKEVIKEGVDRIVDKETPEKVKKIWEGFCFSEKMMAVGAVVTFISFFLPWVTSKYVSGVINGWTIARENSAWLYLFPLLAVTSLLLVFLNYQKDSVAKTLAVRWQIVIGTFFASIAISGGIMGGSLFEFLGAGMGIGWWLMFLGGVVILVGGLKFQDELVKKKKE